MESVALRLITGLGNSEVMPSLTRYTFCSDTKANLISTDSEELNRVLVLTMARAIHVTGETLCIYIRVSVVASHYYLLLLHSGSIVTSEARCMVAVNCHTVQN